MGWILTLSIILNIFLIIKVLRLRKHDPKNRNVVVDTIEQLLLNSNPNNWDWYVDRSNKRLSRIEHRKQDLVIRLIKRDYEEWITPYRVTDTKDLKRIFEAVNKLLARRIADKDSSIDYNPTLQITMPQYMNDTPVSTEPQKPPKIQPQIIPEGSSTPLKGPELEQYMKRIKNE